MITLDAILTKHDKHYHTNKLLTYRIMKKTLFGWALLGTLALSTSCSDSDVADEVQPPVTPPETTDPEPPAETVSTKRMLWASINGRNDATYIKEHNNKILVSWRMLPSDQTSSGFDLYRKSGDDEEVKLNTEPITNSTNFQDTEADHTVDNTYRLCLAGSNETLDTYTITARQASEGLPYISIPLKAADTGHPDYIYDANDCSIGDVDGDGVYEIIVKRLATPRVQTRVLSEDEEEDEGESGGSANTDVWNQTLLECYKLNGTFLWRVELGPNIPTSNSLSFVVYDLDGDGRAEVAFRTSEGTKFADGKEIGDTNGDGKIDYRSEGHIHGMDEFLSVVDGTTGVERARTPYIPMNTSEEWGDDYWKRAQSARTAVGCFNGSSQGSIMIGRGVYGKMVIESYNYKPGELTREWAFNTDYLDDRENWEGQANHSLCIGDVDNDGKDEIVYGGCCIDHNGKGLWLSENGGLGHGDCMYLGKFDPAREGLQLWSCFEASRINVGAALRDARTGNIIWDYKFNGDMGRCGVADIDPDSPGCEMWWYHGNAHSANGQDLGYGGSLGTSMQLWFSGSLNRQLFGRATIDAPRAEDGKGRVFTIYRYDVTTNNSTKENPGLIADIVGDWREEVILPKSDYSELRIFSTWFPCEYKFPYLMSDHLYEMSALNQNLGYNMPTQTSYYLGSDLKKENN